MPPAGSLSPLSVVVSRVPKPRPRSLCWGCRPYPSSPCPLVWALWALTEPIEPGPGLGMLLQCNHCQHTVYSSSTQPEGVRAGRPPRASSRTGVQRTERHSWPERRATGVPTTTPEHYTPNPPRRLSLRPPTGWHWLSTTKPEGLAFRHPPFFAAPTQRLHSKLEVDPQHSLLSLSFVLSFFLLFDQA